MRAVYFALNASYQFVSPLHPLRILPEFCSRFVIGQVTLVPFKKEGSKRGSPRDIGSIKYIEGVSVRRPFFLLLLLVVSANLAIVFLRFQFREFAANTDAELAPIQRRVVPHADDSGLDGGTTKTKEPVHERNPEPHRVGKDGHDQSCRETRIISHDGHYIVGNGWKEDQVYGT